MSDSSGGTWKSAPSAASGPTNTAMTGPGGSGLTLTFDEWLEIGMKEGYCSSPVCNTHDGLPSSEEEDAEWEDGGDPCVPAVRLFWHD
jgi:hypothetical protein